MRPTTTLRAAAAAALLALFLLPAGAPAGADDQPIAPLLTGLGDHTFPVSSEVPDVQSYFDQGLVLAYGFNHAEAERSFREAARRDPDCAICWWGVAYVLGPNINAPMEADAVPRAWEALERARRLAPKASERERAFIRALAPRYAPEPLEDRSRFDRAYADAMRELAHTHPEDTDALTLYAESLMDTMPWDYWQEDGTPKPDTVEVLATLERVFELEPDHPGANHFYIHAVEKQHPERGLAAADRLNGLIPGAGHLVHMPSHIYMNVGRYHQATEANIRAVASDREYLVQCHAQGLYPVNYASHNHQFLVAAATLEGRGGIALQAAREMRRNIEEHHAEHLRGPGAGTAQQFWATPLFPLVRFGHWQEILEEPEPPADLLYPRGLWHYARGVALARTGRPDAAEAELARLGEIIADPALEGMTFWDMNLLTDLLGVARHVTTGEIAAAREDWPATIAALEAGVAAEDALNYDDPPDWHHPVRQILGAVLLEAGRYAEAERVYREDLERVPENGWSLKGLAAALAGQGRDGEAGEVARRFERAWEHADVRVASSRL